MPDRLRLQVWTPLPPRRSGVADYNLLLLPALAELADVTVVADDGVRAPEGVGVVRRAHAHSAPTDLAIYHMGNHHGLHRSIHDEAIARPGLLVLHDPSLVDFYRAYHEGSPGGFEAEVTFNHGPLDGGPPRVRAGTDWHLDRLALHLARRVVEPSRATVVHSPWARDSLARQFPHKAIHHVDLAAPAVDEGAGGPDMRRRAGWGEEHVVFGLLGGLWAHKRPELVVQIITALHPLRPRARLLVAGRLEDGDALNRMRAGIADAGLDDVVHVATDIDDDEFTACIAACDVLVDLRWPSAGETSATVMRAFGAGRPVIVSDLPQYRALDDRFCWRVPTDPGGAATAAFEVMLDVARDPARARRAGRLAREFVRASASLERVAERYEQIARQVVEAGDVTGAGTAIVDAPPPPGDPRATLGLPAGATLFLALLDSNPEAAVEAFTRAFSPGAGARLVVAGPVTDELQRAVEAADGIVVEPPVSPRALISAADVVVSLHRAPTPGRPLAEAMFQGKPVIATADVDFMTSSNACLVGSEADVEQAAAWMRHLHANPEERRRIGARAAADVRGGHRFPPPVMRLSPPEDDQDRPPGPVTRLSPPEHDQDRPPGPVMAGPPPPSPPG